MTEGISIANRNWLSQRIFSMHAMAVSLDACIDIGATGAPTIRSGSSQAIASITRLEAGRYRLRLQDNFKKILQFGASFRSPVTGSSVAAADLVTDTIYQITAVGTTNWASVGLPSGLTAAVGDTFKASGTASGTGTAKAIGYSGIQAVELLSDAQAMLNSQPFAPGSGGYIDFQCVGATNADTTTPVATDPANGSALYLRILLSNSSIQ